MKCANVKIRFKNVCAWLSFLPPGTWHSNVMLSPSLNGPTEPCPSTCLPRSSIINGFWGGTEKYEIHLILNLIQNILESMKLHINRHDVNIFNSFLYSYYLQWKNYQISYVLSKLQQKVIQNEGFNSFIFHQWYHNLSYAIIF